MMIGQIVTRFASRLRYPTLQLVAGLFVVDLFLPDFIPSSTKSSRSAP
jgi:hypothetical protein